MWQLESFLKGEGAAGILPERARRQPESFLKGKVEVLP
jgi:hypothetical protein